MKLKKLLMIAMMVVFSLTLTACGKDGGSGSKKNLSPKEKMAVGRWVGIDSEIGAIDLYSDGTGVYHSNYYEDYDGRYLEWEYDASGGSYVIYEVSIADEDGDEHDKYGMRTWQKEFKIEEITVGEEADNIQGFASVGQKVYKAQYAVTYRMVRTDTCDIDPYGYALETSFLRSLPEFKDGKKYNVASKEGAKSIALYKELGFKEYKESLEQ